MGVYRVLGKRLTMALGEMVRVVTAVSPVAAEPIRGSTEPLIIPNGVDTASLRVDVDRVSTRVSFLGRDEPRKGLDVLLKAWPAVVERFGDAELVVMGVEREDAGVRFMGRVDDATKAEVLSSSAVYVAPNTHGESFGITLVEGMASGAAVLASDLPAFTYVGRDGARYFETGSASSLAATLIELLTDNAMRDSVASRGVERARAFDWSFVATAYKETYLRAIS
jgi:phosphatidylinositol alpha-mannosyltransferase